MIHVPDTSRRTFLEAGAMALAAGLVPLSPATARPLDPSTSLSVPPALPDLPVLEWTIPDFQAAFRSGRYSSLQVCRLYLDRIGAMDRKGPAVNSMIELNPDAESIARQLDSERKAGKVRGPLHGIPIVIKDNIATADRMETTAGSLALVGHKPPRDAFIVERLRAAGAIILGKTNLSEWANFRSNNSTSGWSGRGGLTRSPYALDRNPCGSSSGTGVAIAANFCAIGIGTETDGSIVCPSSHNALVGIKPTVGLVSRTGIIPISHTQDTAGPMCRTVTDAAILLGVMAGADPADSATRDATTHATDYSRFLDPNGLSGARIGVAREGFFGYSDAVDKLAEEAIALMKKAGAEIVDPADIPHANDYGSAEGVVLRYDFKHDIQAYLATLGAGAPKTLADLIAFNTAHAREEMPWFGQDSFERSDKCGPLTDDAYIEAQAHCRRLSRTEGLDVAFADHKLDAIIAPTGGPPWTTDLVNGDHFGGSSSSPAAVSGYPSITVPMGQIFGLPVGLSFIGTAWSEGRLISLAYAYEQASKARKPPTFQSTVNGRP
ncbi:MAG TPA: amidase [Gemmatimonadales bacterium]|nr:amidase [Gemmatimonadales bacterium]